MRLNKTHAQRKKDRKKREENRDLQLTYRVFVYCLKLKQSSLGKGWMRMANVGDVVDTVKVPEDTKFKPRREHRKFPTGFLVYYHYIPLSS